MAQIGFFIVDAFIGRMEPATQKNTILEADVGTDGMGVVIGGWSAPMVDILTHSDIVGSAEALRDSYRAMSGTVITVVDQFDVTWNYVTVIGVRVNYAQIVGGGTYRVSAAWRLLPETRRPPA